MGAKKGPSGVASLPPFLKCLFHDKINKAFERSLGHPVSQPGVKGVRTTSSRERSIVRRFSELVDIQSFFRYRLKERSRAKREGIRSLDKKTKATPDTFRISKL
jgi:hypothetical protein